LTDTEALIVLNMVDGLGPVKIGRIIESFGSPSEALGAHVSALGKVRGIGRELAARIAGWDREIDLQAEINLIKREAVKIITILDASYPVLLKEIYDPPPILYVKGSILPEDGFAIAVVGSRRASRYGIDCAFRLGRDLSARGVTVVSGMARGIDTSAHRGALRGGGRTIAVLGSGVNVIYPPENDGLAREIEESGAVVSEFPMNTIPDRMNFPMRNRTISGLSRGVIVVEAAKKSGALITADFAAEQGRTVFAVPGRIDAYSSRGTLDLIKDGARMVAGIEDIMEEFGICPGTPAPDAPRPRLSRNEETVYNLLGNEETPIDKIIAGSGLAPGEVSAALLSLELKKLVRQLPGKKFSRSI